MAFPPLPLGYGDPVTLGSELELKAQTDDQSSLSYAQSAYEKTLSNGVVKKTASNNEVGRTDRNLTGTGTSKTISGSKTSIAFSLSFRIKLENRTPFDPSKGRC